MPQTGFPATNRQSATGVKSNPWWMVHIHTRQFQLNRPKASNWFGYLPFFLKVQLKGCLSHKSGPIGDEKKSYNLSTMVKSCHATTPHLTTISRLGLEIRSGQPLLWQPMGQTFPAICYIPAYSLSVRPPKIPTWPVMDLKKNSSFHSRCKAYSGSLPRAEASVECHSLSGHVPCAMHIS